jgi:hypothetical protein
MNKRVDKPDLCDAPSLEATLERLCRHGEDDSRVFTYSGVVYVEFSEQKNSRLY